MKTTKTQKASVLFMSLVMTLALFIGAGSASAASDDPTLTDISSSVTWQSGMYTMSNDIFTKSNSDSSICTVASFPKQSVLLKVKDGYSFEFDEVSESGSSYKKDRRYYYVFDVPFNKWISMGYFNVYPERKYLISVKDNSGKALTADMASSVIEMYSVDNVNHIPEYYQNYIKNKANVINNLQSKDNAFSFIYMTDIHIQHNTKHFPGLVRYLYKNCGINDIIGNGDWVTAWLSDADGVQGLWDDYDELDTLFAGLPLIKSAGNHDWAYGSSNQYNVSEAEIYEHFYKPNIEAGLADGSIVKADADATYFYKDDVKNKMRYIDLTVMDYPSTEENLANGKNKAWYYYISDEQADWVKTTALKMPDDEWTCVVFAHVPILNREEMHRPSDLVVNREKIRGIIKDFVGKTGDFKDYKGSFIAWLSGHTHEDFMVYTADDFTSVVSNGDCQIRTDGTPERTVNTINEQSFNVFTVDKAKRRVYITRIGAGDDRCFVY